MEQPTRSSETADGPQHPDTPFLTILFSPSDIASPTPLQQPACFRDLNLDQIVTQAISSKEDYDLGPFFHQALRDKGLSGLHCGGCGGEIKADDVGVLARHPAPPGRPI